MPRVSQEEIDFKLIRDFSIPRVSQEEMDFKLIRDFSMPLISIEKYELREFSIVIQCSRANHVNHS